MTTDEWTCSNCGSTDPHDAIVFNDEIEIDVTCGGVYFTFVDGSKDPGMFFDFDEFDSVVEHYEEARND